jgi:hypothetical protein
MRIIEVKGCASCPYFEQTNGYNRVWVCRKGYLTAHDNPNGRLKKNGGYPQFASWRTHAKCRLKKV